MGELLFFGVLFFFGYPFIAAAISSRGLRKRLSDLEDLVRSLRKEIETLRSAGRDAPAAPAIVVAPPTPEPAPTPPPVFPPPRTAPATPVFPRAPVEEPAFEPEPEVAPLAAVVNVVDVAQSPVPPAAPVPAVEPEFVPPPRPAPARAAPTPPPAWLLAAKNWLFTGNLVAKMGLLILFIGVSFLLKYASERFTVPIELRLAGIVLADIGLLVWGWRLRLTHRNLALPIQGAALAILMLVTFGAFHLYGLIPPGMAFTLLFVLTVFTCLLAVLQDAVWLAVFGISGGFVAPILTSTGHGSHIGLFSYYALLNAGILGIGLKRTWRSLNLLGFGFTFLIGTAWGVQRYVADEHYLSAQLFLILFFLFYVAIAIIYAQRQAAVQKAYVDATVVFGTAMAAFSLQLGMMKHVVFGNALSALGFGVFYTVLAMVLWRRRAGKLKLLVESFLALGLVFGTLALPFALDGRWTSAAWALEGAGVAWVGLRQRQRLVFGFGMLVQAGAWISFIGAISGLAPQAARDSNLWLGFLILAITAFFMATTFRAQKEGDEPMYPRAASWLLGIAAIWFMGGAWTEIFLRQSDTALANMLVVSGLATAALLAVIARRMQWENASRFSLVAQTVAGVTLLCVMMENWDWDAARNPFDRPLLGTLMIFAGALFTSWNIFRMPSSTAIARLGKVLLAWAAFWWFLPILDILHGSLWWQLGDQGTSTADGSFSLYLACVALSGVLFAVSARRLAWPDLRRLSVPAWIAMVLMTVVITSLLYQDRYENLSINWVCFALCWSASEFLLRLWPASAWPIRPRLLKLVHLVRTAGPWILLWKVGANAIEHWLRGADQDQQLLSDAGINASASWASFVPFWLMMAALMWLIKRSRAEQWPVAPIAAWYRRALIPAATAWSLLLVAAWNMFQDGTMAPLPYVPLANPLDISTGFALFVAVFSYRQLKAEGDTLPIGLHKLVQRLPMAGAVLTYVWLNLILLRTASHVLDITYNLPTLFDSQIVQAMLSLVWSITALVLMRLATRKLSRKQWMVGAAFLALVVAKLFLVDQASTGSVARIVAFIGVGLLMVLIAYLAPYPAAPAEPSGE